MSCRIRPVDSAQELASAFDVAGAQISPSFDHTDRRFSDLARRYPEDRPIMLVADVAGCVVGAALAFRGADGVTLRVIGLEPAHRGMGIGRQLMRRLEAECARLGDVRGIALGANPDSRPFYVKLGYRGRSRMYKELAPARAGQVDRFGGVGDVEAGLRAT
jgi:GNAT superfamily N-acetyltransferase